MDGVTVATTLLPMGDGTHMIPVKAALRTAIHKGDGETVVVHLTDRFS